jgi:hypothetical protein
MPGTKAIEWAAAKFYSPAAAIRRATVDKFTINVLL